ncbi:MAG: hypothetical protein RIC55_24055 [Pirellulaceae bacterium]
MKRCFATALLVASPLLGLALGVPIAWRLHPHRETPTGASLADHDRLIGQVARDVEARSRCILWGSIGGGAVGVLGAAALAVSSRGRRPGKLARS